MYSCKFRYVQAIYKCCLRLYKEKKKKGEEEEKKIKIELSLGYPYSYFYNKRFNMLL